MVATANADACDGRMTAFRFWLCEKGTERKLDLGIYKGDTREIATERMRKAMHNLLPKMQTNTWELDWQETAEHPPKGRKRARNTTESLDL